MTLSHDGFAPARSRTTSSFRQLDELPGPAAMPVVGYRGNFLKFALDPVGYLDGLTKYGRLVLFAKGMDRGVFRPAADKAPATVFAYGPDILGHCFNTAHAEYQSIHITPPPGASYKMLTWGVQRLHGAEHKRHRKLLMPAFHGKRLDGYRDILVTATREAMVSWKPGGTIDIVDEVRRILLVFLNRAFLGLDDTTGMLSMGGRLEEVWGSMFSLLVRAKLPGRFSPQARAIGRADAMVTALEELVAKKRAATVKGDDMLAMLLGAQDEEGSGLTKEELIGHLSFLIFAGFESTIHAVAFSVYLVAQHPEVAAKLHDEMDSALHGDAPTMAQLKTLPYLDAVVKESLRLLSPVPFLMRTTEEPLVLNGVELPARTELMLSLYHTHRMPETFPEPAKFRPERWETLTPSTYEYLPFGVGPHMCAGWALALMEMKVLLAMFVQGVRLDVLENAKVDRRMMATLGPRGGLTLGVHAQDKNFAASRKVVSGHLASMVTM